WLTPWNVLEYKGKTVSARVADLDSLVELGLGVHRRLNELEVKEGRPEVDRQGMSWWYLARHLGWRFLRDAAALLGQELEELAPGVWRARLPERALLLVSGDELEVNRDSLPLHVLGGVPEAARPTVAQLLRAEPELARAYGGWLALYEPIIWQEV